MRVGHRRRGDQTGVSETCPHPRAPRCCSVWLGTGKAPHCGALLVLTDALFPPVLASTCCPGPCIRQSPQGPRLPLSPGRDGAPKVPAIRVCGRHVFSFLSHVPLPTGPFSGSVPHMSGCFPKSFLPCAGEDLAEPAGHQVAWLGPQRVPACTQAPLLGPCPSRRAWLHPNSFSRPRHPPPPLLSVAVIIVPAYNHGYTPPVPAL